MKVSISERRLKVIYFSESRILGLFLDALPVNATTFCLPRIIGMPENVEVISVHHDWERNSFGFLLRHESFEPVSEACEPPEIKVEYVPIHFPLPNENENTN